MSQSKSRRVSQPVFRFLLALSQRHNPIHLVLVPLDQRDIVSKRQMVRVHSLVFESSLKNALGLGEAVEEQIAKRQTAISQRKVGMDGDLFLRHLDRPFKAACPMGGNAS